MAGLQQFIGSRDVDGKLLVNQGRISDQGKQQRLRATIQSLGFTDLNGDEVLSSSTGGAADLVKLNRKRIADQHRIKFPTRPLGRDITGPKVIQGARQSYDSTLAPHQMDDGAHQKNRDTSQSLFDTDADSIEVTATFSDFSDFKDHGNALQGNDHQETHLDRVNDVGEDEIVSDFDDSRIESFDGKRPKCGEGEGDPRIDDLKAQMPPEPSRILLLGQISQSKSPQAGEMISRLAPEMTLDPPVLNRNSSSRHPNDPIRSQVMPIASKMVEGGGSYGAEDQTIQSGYQRLPQIFSKPGQGRLDEDARYIPARYPTPQKAAIPEGEILANPRQLSHKALTQNNEATVLPLASKSSETGIFGGSEGPDAIISQDDMDSSSRKRATGLDYTTRQLASMTYNRLSSETFDSVPRSPSSEVPEDLAGAILPQKLEYVYSLKRSDKQYLQRREVFSYMNINQYDECGSLLMEKFGNIITRYTDARQQKRKAAKEFEDEVAVREEHVRGISEGVDGDLRRLKTAGEDVIRGSDN